MKLRALALLILISVAANAQVKIIKLDKSAIPKTVKYKGHIINAVSYTDTEGKHLVITTETGETPTKGSQNESRDAALYAYHYKIYNNTYKLTWQIDDLVEECIPEAIIKAKYLPGTFAVTDLNKDGKAEVWMMYKIACTADANPADMKIIMYQGDKKYAVVGTNQVEKPKGQTFGGGFDLDQSFKAGPAVFRQYAKTLWKKNIWETWK